MQLEKDSLRQKLMKNFKEPSGTQQELSQVWFTRMVTKSVMIKMILEVRVSYTWRYIR